MDDFTNSKRAAESWLQANDSKFQLISEDQDEKRLVFGISGTQISFIITCPNSGDFWGVWSDHDKVLSQLRDEISYVDGKKNLTLETILNRVTRSLSTLSSSEESSSPCEKEGSSDDLSDDAVDNEEDEDEDAYQFDYYEEEDPDVKEGEHEAEEEKMATFYEANGDRAKPSTIQRLVSDMRSLTKTGEKYGFSACPEGNNLFKWNVKLLDIPEDCRLGKDLRRYAKDKQQEAVIHMEMQFPYDYPFSPPFLRVVRPRFKFLTGHVTIGGSICMEMLTKSGWLPTNDIEGILVQVRSEILSDPNASLDTCKWDMPYTEEEAREAFKRMVSRYGWD